MNGRIPYWYESAAGTASVSPGSAGVVAEWPVGPACSVVVVQTGSCSRVGVWLFWADWRAGPSWPVGIGGVTTWSFGLEKEQEGRVEGHGVGILEADGRVVTLPEENIFCCLICSFWRRCCRSAWWLGLTLDSRPVWRGTEPSSCPGNPCFMSVDLSLNAMAA